MQLTDKHIAKIDPLLQEALMQATGDELMRAIAVLNTDDVAIAATLDPAAFSSRVAYREALIAQRQNQLQAALGATMRSLQDLDLKTSGGSISPILVVEGTAKQVLAALELAGVRHASLEQLIGLPEIVPASAIEHLVKIYVECLAGDIDQRTKELIYQAAQQYILYHHKLYDKFYDKLDMIPIVVESKLNDKADLDQVIGDQFRRFWFPRVDEFVPKALVKGVFVILWE